MIPRLENWSIENRGLYSIAWGHVYDSPKFNDGEYIHTSFLRQYSLSEKKVTTNNSTYLLGLPASAFTPPPEQDVPCIQQPIDQVLG
jgi:hypothetical protein